MIENSLSSLVSWNMHQVPTICANFIDVLSGLPQGTLLFTLSNTLMHADDDNIFLLFNNIDDQVLMLGQLSNVCFFQLVLISWMVTLSSCLIWHIINFILPPNEYGWISGSAIDIQKMSILAKNHLFRSSSFWFWRVCKQIKLSHLGAQETLKSRRTQNVSLFGTDFGPEA